MKVTRFIFLSIILFSCKNNEVEKQKEKTCDEVVIDFLNSYNAQLLKSDTSVFASLIKKSDEIIKCPGLKDSLMTELLLANIKIQRAKYEIPISLTDEKFNEITKGLAIKYDDMNNWYSIVHPSSPKFIDYKGFFIKLVYEKNQPLYGRLQFQYSGPDWLFIKTVKIKVDDNSFELIPSQVKTEILDGGNVAEWFYLDLPEEITWLELIKPDSKIKTRIYGKTFSKDWDLNQSQIKALYEMFHVYKKMINS